MDTSVCNNKQRPNNKCQCECKELIDKGECDKSCYFSEYENCKCRKTLVDELVEECNENIDEAKLSEIALFEHKNEYACYYTVFINNLNLFVLTICIWIITYFVYYKYMNRNKENVSVYDYVYHSKNY